MEAGKIINHMEKEKNYTMMDPIMKDNFEMERNMEKAFLLGLMEKHIKDNLKMERWMVMVNFSLKIKKVNLLVNLKKV